MIKRIFLLVVSLSILVLVIFLSKAYFDDCRYIEKSFKSDWHVYDKSLEIWANKVVKDKKDGCLFKNYGGMIYEFIGKGEYSTEKFPGAVLLNLRPIEVIKVVDEYCMLFTCYESLLLVKFVDQNNVIYLSPESESKWAQVEISPERTSESPESFATAFLKMSDIFQNLDEKSIERGKDTKFYKCVNGNGFESFSKKIIIEYCPYYYNRSAHFENSPDESEIGLQIIRLPEECSCYNIKKFLDYQAVGWITR